MKKHAVKSKNAHTKSADSQEKKDKAFGIASLICGLLFWVPLFNVLLGPLAIIFGVMGIKRVRADPERYGGQGLAIAGLVLGIISVIFTLIGLYIAIFNPELVLGTNITGLG